MLRPFRFTHRHFENVRNSILRDGVIQISGDGTTKHSFVTVKDVAKLAVASLGKLRALNATLDIGGPELLSSLDVARLYESALGKKLQIKTTPARVFRLLSVFFRPFSLPASNIMAITHMTATTNTGVTFASETAAQLGVTLTSAGDFLRSKLQLGIAA